MSDFYTLISQISKTAPLKAQISHIQDILLAIQTFSLPSAVTTVDSQVVYRGQSMSFDADSTGWMKVGMILQIGSVVGGSFRGIFGEVTEVTGLSFTVTVRELSNITATEVLQSGVTIGIGAVNGVRTASAEATVSRWIRLKSGGSWTPTATSAVITARFWVSDKEVGTRSITVNFNNGVLSTTASGLENGIGINVVSQNGPIFTVRFTLMDSVGGFALNSVEKTIDALDFSIADGATGPTGVPGYANVYGLWDTFFVHPANAGYQSIVYRGTSWYVTKDPDASLGPLEGPPSDNSAENTWWEKVAIWKNVATSLMSGARFKIGPNTEHYLEVTDKKVEVSGIISPRPGSNIPSQYVDAELMPPIPYPAPGTFDSVSIVVPAPSTGARIYYNLDNSGIPDSGDTLYNPNFLKETHDFDETIWVKTAGTIVTDAAKAPDPSKTAYKAIGGATRLQFYQELQNNEAGNFITRGNYWTGSIYVKATSADITEVSIGLQEYDGTTYRAATWKNYKISSTDWTRIPITHKVTQGSDDVDRLRLEIICLESNSTLDEGLFIAMSQLQFGRFMSVYQENDTARAGLVAMPGTAATHFRAVAIKFGESSFESDSIYTTTAAGPTDAVSKPFVSPVPGPYEASEFPLSVEIFCNTSGATIHYTTDGSTPTTGSTVYSGPIALADFGTVKALAVKAGRADSEIMVATYTQPNGQKYTVATPTADPVAGGYETGDFPLSVELACATAGATIYYTTDGSDPTIYSTQYSSAINVEDGDIIKAIAVRDGWNDSEVLNAYYYDAS